MVRLPLPSLQEEISEVIENVFDNLYREGGNQLISQACYKLLAAAIEHCETAVLSEVQMKIALQYCVTAVSSTDTQNTAFTLLLALLNRKFVSPSMYDIMWEVRELLVKRYFDSCCIIPY